MEKSRLLDALSATIFIFLSTATSAELIDNGGGLVYDDVLDITWSQPRFKSQTWDDANTLVSGLTLGGVSGWRLPYISVAAGAGPITSGVVDCSSATELACRDNEMGYMFYHNLSGTYGNSIWTSGDPDLTLFLTLSSTSYWSGTKFGSYNMWYYSFSRGFQFFDHHGDRDRIWAVHEGSVSVDVNPAVVFSQPPLDEGVSYGSHPSNQTLDDFALSSDASVTNLQWWGHEVNDTFLIRFFSDTGTGSPEVNPFLTMTVTNPVRSATGLNSWPGQPIFEYAASLPQVVPLLGGERYYLSIITTQRVWGWASSYRGIRHWYRGSDGDSWTLGSGRGMAFELSTEPITPVTIDIKPGSEPNSINPRSKGVIAVAVLTSEDFDALQVDPDTVLFGPADTAKAHSQAHVEDVDYDGDMDLVFHFRTQETGIQCSDTEATLTGETWDGTPISGTDSVNTVGCR